MANGKKPAAAAYAQARSSAAGRLKKAKTRQLEYTVAIGGTFGAVLLALVMAVFSPNRGPLQTMVNDPSLIAQVNNRESSWRAGSAAMFDGWTVKDVRSSLEGVAIAGTSGAMTQCAVAKVPVPERFDAREKWPQCFHSPIYSMGNCSASWAIAAASSLSDRLCISGRSESPLSPQQLLSCDTSNRGCAGGYVDSVWAYIQQEGLVTEQCLPYEADAHVACDLRRCGRVELRERAAAPCFVTSELDIRREILTAGPVVALVFLFDDFLVYRGGVYQESRTASAITDARRQRIPHAVKLMGWGEDQGRPYWLLENSFGEDWGENGYARVLRGAQSSDAAARGGKAGPSGIVIETFAVAGTPANPTFARLDGRSEGLESEAEDGDDA